MRLDVVDLVQVIQSWGACAPPEAPCPADFNDDGEVDVQDLLQVIIGWGACG